MKGEREPRSLFLVFAVLLCFAYSVAADSTNQPNIVIIIVDDAGVADTEFSSPSGPIQTPNLASIAKEGVVLTEYYAHPTCTPSRAALMTGKYAHNTGLPFPLIGKPVGGLSPEIPVMPEILKDMGYATHMVGKWHLGHSKKSFTPTRRGFDSFFGLHGGGFDHYSKSIGTCTDLWRGESHVPNVNHTEHATTLFTNEAIKVIRQHHNDSTTHPLFLYLAYTAPHDPLQADAEYVQQCSHIPHRTRRMFCAMMRQLDDSIGRVKKTLEETGMWDNTILMFTSDNGGMPLCGGFNYPFRGSKSMAWEGGVRVPAFIRVPSWTPGHYGGLMHISDWLPTLVSLAEPHTEGVAASKSLLPSNLDGVDMSAAIEKKAESPRKDLVAQLDIFLNSSSYRSGCMKLLLGCPGGNQLFVEPTNYLLEREGEQENIVARWVVEMVLDLIEMIFKPPIDQFFKYVFILQTNKFQDWRQGTSYTHLLSRYQLNNVMVVNLTDLPPVVEPPLSVTNQRAFLFDVCKDPSESNNLAPSNPDLVQKLYKQFAATFRDSPLQFAGDTVDSAAPEEAGCGPWIDEDVDLATMSTVNSRVFASLEKSVRAMTVGILLLFALPPILIVVLWYCWCRRKQNKTKKD